MMAEYKNAPFCTPGMDFVATRVRFGVFLYSGNNGEQVRFQMPGKLCIFVQK